MDVKSYSSFVPERKNLTVPTFDHLTPSKIQKVSQIKDKRSRLKLRMGVIVVKKVHNSC